MADRALFIGWGQTVRGREERALEVFSEAVGLYGRMQQEGRIEKFDVCLLEPHGGGLDGYIALYGSEDQIGSVRADTDFQRNLVDANLVVDELGVVAGWVNEGVAHQMAMFTEAIARVPQPA
ncbi:MAG TPA: hypothetical protein VHF89_18765 [Solirubrobacteraceae bacterium]|nr:hypothetical protein [Solirubrobacteraceae bacterium]